MKNKMFHGIVFIIPILIILLVILLRDRSFTYTLDDPYIHIELAKNIYFGTYGINTTEMSAPSSSIIWPFILVPFAGTHFLQYIPLILNSICVLISGFILLKIFDFKNIYKNLFFAVGFLYAFNCYGLIFNGLEHSLQVLLVITICYYLINFNRVDLDKKSILIFLLSLICLPLVRYEGLAISIPVLVFLYFNNLKKEAVTATSIIFILILGFSLFLYLNNLGVLPSSIISKTFQTDLSIKDNFFNNISTYGWFFSLVLIFVMIIWKKNKSLALILLATTMLHFLFGKCGWFGRYEIYYLVFSFILMLNYIFHQKVNIWFYPIFLIFAFPILVETTNLTAKASSNIYNQQFRMSQIVQKLDAPVAVNDLGLVALNSNKYVLDLWGLGSIEALNYRKNETDYKWIQKLMAQNSVNYAIVYDEWFPDKPENWLKAGELKLTKPRITPASDVVVFYATDEKHLLKLKDELKSYRKEHPSKYYEIIIN